MGKDSLNLVALVEIFIEAAAGYISLFQTNFQFFGRFETFRRENIGRKKVARGQCDQIVRNFIIWENKISPNLSK
jgi:hypothetical protein